MGISLLFILVFFINLFLNSRLLSLKKDLDTKLAKLETYSEVETSYIAVAKSITKYKNLKDTKVSMYDRVLVIKDSIPEGISITSLRVSPSEFRIVLSGNNLLLFSFVLDKYVKSPLISTIYLENASLTGEEEDTEIATYGVTIRGIFK